MIVIVRDVYGDRLAISCAVSLTRVASGTHQARIAQVHPRNQAEFQTSPSSTYRLEVKADGYAHVGRLIDGRVDQTRVLLPVCSSAVIAYEWPAEPGPFPPAVVFEDLDDTRRATLLNIWAKLWSTPLVVAPLATLVNAIVEVRDDRIIVELASESLALLAASEEFDTASSFLHEPPTGYRRGASFKTLDRAANLQVSTFISKSDGALLADIDLDEARGLSHLLDVAEHHLSGRKTDPVEIHQLLVSTQNIDPGWRPLV